MPNGGVTRDTFKHADTNSKLSILYDQQLEMIHTMKQLQLHDTQQNTHCVEQWGKCDDRFKSIEKNWYKIAGALVLLGAAVPFVSKLVVNFLT